MFSTTGTGPAFVNATLADPEGVLTITFDEIIDVSETDLTKLYLVDADEADPACSD